MVRVIVGVGALIAAALVACGESAPEVNTEATVEAAVAARIDTEATIQAGISAGIQATAEAQPPPTAMPANVPATNATPGTANTPVPTTTPRPTNTPVPTTTPRPTNTPVPTTTPRPTNTPAPTTTPRPTSTPAPRVTPTNTPIPRPTETPTITPTLTPVVPPTPTPAPITEVNFSGVVTSTNSPSQVQVVFALRDQNGRSIVLPAGEVERNLKVYEVGPGTDGWEEIDYAETSFFVHTAENIDLEVVFVLDFTNSMSAARLADGRSGIQAMLGAFDSALAVLPAAHRIGVVEFHDRNAAPSVLSGLTTDRQALLQSVERFSQSGFDSGSSRVWDSIITASSLFSSRSENPRAVRAVVFLSDGRDTSSEILREAVAERAQGLGVQLYALGVGEVFQEAQLRAAAESTGGAYYSARDFSLLQEQLQILVSDLRGQYQLTYITLRRTGEYRTGLAVNMGNIEGSTAVGPFDTARFFGPDNQGVIVFDPPSFDAQAGTSKVFMRAQHMPRNIDRIRFKVDTSNPLSVELVGKADGGLLDGWTISGPDGEGYYQATSQTPLAFGNLGLLFTLTFSSTSQDDADVPIEFDNTIYPGGKSLAYSRTLGIAPPTPLTGRIAFRSNRDGNWEIYVMNADGSNVTRLANHPEGNESPAWSPDGRRIAFNSYRDGNLDIYVMNADGSNVTRLTNHPEGNGSPAWSPDGRRIAFTSYRDGNLDIYVMNADGSNVTRLTNHPEGNGSPAWSPDGRRIAFTSYRDGNWEIYVMNADGSNVTRLTNHPEQDTSPAWSPDGRRIAFRSNRDGNVEIYVMNADGSNVTRLTNHPEWDGSPAWSPDGRRIAFESNRDGNSEIYVMDADGSNVTRLTNHPEVDLFPAWTAD